MAKTFLSITLSNLYLYWPNFNIFDFSTPILSFNSVIIISGILFVFFFKTFNGTRKRGKRKKIKRRVKTRRKRQRKQINTRKKRGRKYTRKY